MTKQPHWAEEIAVNFFKRLFAASEGFYDFIGNCGEKVGISEKQFSWGMTGCGALLLLVLSLLLRQYGLAELCLLFFRSIGKFLDLINLRTNRTIYFYLFRFLGYWFFISIPLFFLSLFVVVPIKKFFSEARPKKHGALKIFGHSKRVRARKNNPPTSHLLGLDREKGRPILLTHEARNMHTLVVGSTGVGKTDSVFLPTVMADLAKGQGMIFIDLKADNQFLAKLVGIVRYLGRENEFYYLSPARPEWSDSYNMLLLGNPAEIKDKIIGATDWSEEHYKKKCEDSLLILARGFRDAKEVMTFKSLHDHLKNRELIKKLIQRCPTPDIQADLQEYVDRFDHLRNVTDGLVSDLGLLNRSDFSHLLNVKESGINLLDVYKNNKIVYFQLNIQGSEATARRLGRMILQDMRAVSNYIQTEIPESERHFFPVWIDEFGSFVYDSFIEFLNKARASGFGVSMATQSLGDLTRVGNDFMTQVMDNTNIKIIMRQDDPDSVEMFARMAGTRESVKRTLQTKEELMMTGMTGMGSLRDVDEFKVNPNRFKELQKGEAVVIMKEPYFVGPIQLDYVPVVARKLKYPWSERQRMRLAVAEEESQSEAGKGRIATEENDSRDQEVLNVEMERPVGSSFDEKILGKGLMLC